MTINRNLIADSYKYSHYLQYPPNTTGVLAYIEARTGARFDQIMFFGLQIYMKRVLSTRITKEDLDRIQPLIEAHIPGLKFNRAGWDIIVNEYNGILPIEIEAVPEGRMYPLGVPLVQVTALDPRLFWLTTFIETALLRAVWYPSTVATLSRAAKEIIWEGLKISSDDPVGQIPFKLHDFGARGASSYETAEIGGLAHLVNFKGTDTFEAILLADEIYGEPMAGFSIPAAEHSTITPWGREREADAYSNMLSQFGKPGAIVAVVSDSYDIMNAVNNIWGDELRQEVLESGATVVIRPDSGDPVETPIAVIKALMGKYGHTINGKGYRVLPQCIRVIQGDGMNLDSIRLLVKRMLEEKLSIDNIAVGMGGGLLQKVDRDTQKMAMKANEAIIDDVKVDVFKAPVGDITKGSKAGRQVVVIRNGVPVALTARAWSPLNAGDFNLLELVWSAGKLYRDMTFSEVRDNASYDLA